VRRFNQHIDRPRELNAVRRWTAAIDDRSQATGEIVPRGPSLQQAMPDHRHSGLTAHHVCPGGGYERCWLMPPVAPVTVISPEVRQQFGASAASAIADTRERRRNRPEIERFRNALKHFRYAIGGTL
jgi:hypothetical protein